LRRALVFTSVIILLFVAFRSVAGAADTDLKTFEDADYTSENGFFQTGSTIYFQSLGSPGADNPVLHVGLIGTEIQVELSETPRNSGIYRGSFRTDPSQTNDEDDVIRTFNGAILQLRSDIDGDGIEGTTDVLNITIDDQPPTPPRWCDANATPYGSVRVNWTEYKGDDFKRYAIFRSLAANFSDARNVANITDPAILQWFDDQSNLLSGQAYWYGVRVVDLAGNPSALRASENYVVPHNDTIAPTAVTGLTGYAPPEGNSINLTWNPNPEKDVVGYKVYHDTTRYFPASNDRLIGFVRGTNFLHSDISANTPHFYVVVAIDEEENPSPHSEVFNATPDDTIPPLPPENLAISSDATGYLNISWTAPSGEEVYLYDIYRSEESGAQSFWSPYARTKSTSYLDTKVENGKTYFYVVRSSDKAGNEEKNMLEVGATSMDSTPPGPPRSLGAEDTDLGKRIKLVWLAPGGETPTEYHIFKSNVSGGENFSKPVAVVSKTYFVDRDVVDGVNYYYVVRSVDAAGNVDTNTEELRVMSRDLTPPPPVVDVIASPRKGGVIGIGWMPPGGNLEDLDLAQQMRADVDHYNVYWSTYEGFKPDPSKMMSTTETSVIHSGLVDGQTYYYIVRSVDAAGNENMDDDLTSTSAVADTSPPGKPEALKTFRLPDGRIRLDWNAPAGEAPYRYDIYRATTRGAENFNYPFAMTFKDTEWIDDNVTHGQWYYYVVRSADFLLNEDQNKLEVGNFSEDLTPPPAPEGLVVKRMKGGSLMLNWTEPTPEVTSPSGPREADMAVLYRVYSSTKSDAFNFSRPIAETPNTFFIDTGLKDGQTYYYVVRSVDGAGNEDQNLLKIKATADASPPSPPVDVVAQRTPRGEVVLTWSDPQGEEVYEYRIYKFTGSDPQDFREPLVTTRRNVYVDNDVSQAVQYRYVIRSVDKPGNEGRNTIETLAPVLLGPPRNVKATPGKNGIIEISWDPPQDGKEDVREYNIYRSAVPGGEPEEPWGTTVVTRYIDTNRTSGAVTQYMVDGMRYYYYVRAVDIYGNEGIKSEEVSAVSDSTPPEKPRNLEAIPEKTGDVTLRWATPHGERVAKYRIYRSTRSGVFNYIAPVDETTRIIYYDKNVQSGTRYYYVVRSVDEAGNEEKNTNEVEVVAFDAPPGPVKSLRAKLRPNGSIVLTWSPPTGEPISYYNIYRSVASGNFTFSEPYARSKIATFTDNFVQNGIKYFYVVRAVDTTGNEEENRNEVSITSKDTEPPGAPANLVAVPMGTGAIRLSWEKPDGEPPANYLIYRSQSPYFNPSIQNFLNKTTRNTYTDEGLDASKTYYYVVHSADSVGNEDSNTNRVSGTTAPNPPTGLEASSKDTGEIMLFWKLPLTPVSGFRVYRATSDKTFNFSRPIAEVPYPMSSYVDSGLNNSQTYYYVVHSVDSRGAEETNTQQVSAISMETIPPLAPTDFKLEQLPSGAIRLEWSHLDPKDVSEYRIYRSKGSPSLTTMKLLASTNLTYFEDLDVVSGDTYSYIVRAVDVHGNEEGNENWRSLMSMDVLPPEPPSNVTARSLPGGAIQLSWIPPRERNVSFLIYRATTEDPANASLIASTNNTGYVDEDLSNGKTYFYIVRSKDLAGNEEKNEEMVSAVANKGGPRILLAMAVVSVFLGGGYVVDRRRRIAEEIRRRRR